MTAWHVAGGYSGTPVDSHTECVKADGFEHVLCAAWHLGDNSGPHDVTEVCAPFPGDSRDVRQHEVVQTALTVGCTPL